MFSTSCTVHEAGEDWERTVRTWSVIEKTLNFYFTTYKKVKVKRINTSNSSLNSEYWFRGVSLYCKNIMVMILKL